MFWIRTVWDDSDYLLDRFGLFGECDEDLLLRTDEAAVVWELPRAGPSCDVGRSLLRNVVPVLMALFELAGVCAIFARWILTSAVAPATFPKTLLVGDRQRNDRLHKQLTHFEEATPQSARSMAEDMSGKKRRVRKDARHATTCNRI